MKKTIIVMAAVAAALAMGSCVKEQPVEPEVPSVAGEDLVVASTKSILTKTSLRGDDAKGYEVVWSEGDEITIGGSTFTLTEGANTTTGTFRGTLPEDGAYTACYPSTYDGTEWPAFQKYAEGDITGSPMKADISISGGKTAGLLRFKNAGGILRLKVKGSEDILVTSIRVSADGLKDITLNCAGGVALDETEGAVFHIAMPEGSYAGASILIMSKSGKRCIKKLRSSNLEIERSKITPASFSAVFSGSEGALPGTFTVSSGRKINFSRGNLYCSGVAFNTDGTVKSMADAQWGFETEQYLSMPGTAANRDNDHISHFMWSGTATGALASKYSNDSATGFFASDGLDIYGCTDWHALSYDDFMNLLFYRDASTVCGTENARWFNGRIDTGSSSINGLFLFPDVFIWPESVATTPEGMINSWMSDYSGPTFSLAEFRVLEDTGIVFLPAAGSRSGSEGSAEVKSVNTTGGYWSSNSSGTEGGEFVSFNNTRIIAAENPHSNAFRYMAQSVRLIIDANPSFSVTFNMNGHGTAPAGIILPYRSKINEPETPSSIGLAFAGWYTDEACTDEWNFETDFVTANITLYAKWVVDVNVIPGVFTVSDDGKGNVKKVQFSRGNLTATIDPTGMPTAWKFAANQYEYLGEGGANQTIGKAAGDVDLFGWSTGATIYGISTSYKDNDYYGDFIEWGRNVGDGRTWRTMTTEEWTYLFNERTMLNGKARYTLNITYGGKMGIVLYPDDYNGPTLVSDTNYTDETFPETCVFLPAAGRRTAYYTREVGVKGLYWSSSPYYIDAYFVLFDAGTTPQNGYNYRWEGCSVRLVMDQPSTYTVTFDMNGHGKAPADITGIQTHSRINEPKAIPTAMGYMFAGWYKDKSCTVRWDFNSDIVTKDITIYARWTEAPAGALPGIFSIAKGKHVYFSKGNLIATIDASGAPSAWKFAANQYDYLGKGGANQTIGEAEGDIDFFGWPTKSTNFGICTRTDYPYYYGDFVDWGKAIGDGSTWRTMSASEWEHLSQHRAMLYVDFRYTLNITYGEKKGVVLYPDDYNGPALIPGTNYTDETFPETCVFLPAAGYRDGAKVPDLDYRQGRYRTSDTDSDNESRALVVYFQSADFIANRLDYRFPGYSVRLVTDRMD